MTHSARLRPLLHTEAREPDLRRDPAHRVLPWLTAALAVVEREGPLTPSELAARERIRRPTATRIVARLQHAGLVARTADPGDRRSSLLTVTDPGRELLATMRTRKDAFLSSRLDALTAADRATLERAAVLLEGLLEEPGA